MSDHSEASIIWDGEMPDADTIAKVRQSIQEELDGLENPSDLVFHNVILTDDIQGPIVTLFGDPAVDGFVAVYAKEADWAPITAL